MAARGTVVSVRPMLEAEGIDPDKRAVVTPKELQGILEAIQNPKDKLDDISRKFQSIFSEPGRFRGCCALVILLRDFLLTLPQRLVVYFLLFDVYRHHKLGVNPFVPVFINALRSGSGISLTERRFSQKLLLNSPSDKATGGLSPSELAESLASQPAATKTPDLGVVMREFELSVPSPPALRQAERGAVVVDPGGTDAKTRGRRAIAEALQADSVPGQALSRDALVAAEAVATSPAEPLFADTLPAVQPTSITASLRLPVASGAASRGPGTQHGAYSLLTVAALLAELDKLETDGAPSSSSSAAAASSAGSVTDPAAGLRGGIAPVPPALMAAAALEGSDPASLGAADLFSLTGFRPVFARPPPPLVGGAEGEMVWLDPAMQPPLLWETGMSAEQGHVSELKSLMGKAIGAGLDTAAANRLRMLLRERPQAVFESGLSPANLPALVARSPLIAVDCLSHLRGSSQIDEFLSALVRMEMSLPSMEVVNAVSLDSKLPKHFLHVYISNCIATCENLKDPFMQSRLVRLVCVFLQSLIRGNVIDVKELFVEVKAFCIAFSNTKEANALYKMIKKFDSGGDA